MLEGTIIENSLSDVSILKNVQVIETRQAGTWILHTVLVEESLAQDFGKYLASGPWYVHFWEPGKDQILVVFKDKTFVISRANKNTWSEAIKYGMSIAIPEDQLTFVVSN